MQWQSFFKNASTLDDEYLPAWLPTRFDGDWGTAYNWWGASATFVVQ